MADEKEFMNELDAAARMKPSMSSNIMLFAVLLMVISMAGWAHLSEVEEITRGSGSVVPSKEIQIVQSLEGGILDELLVKEGDRVEKDQILLRIKDLMFASEGRGTEAEFLALRAKKSRLMAEANGKPLEIDAEIKEKAPKIAANELALYKSRQQELENAKSILDSKISSAKAELSEVGAKINRLSQSKKLLQQELDITKEMVRKKAVPKIDEIRLNRELSDISGQISESVQKRSGLNADLAAAQKERQDQEDKVRSQALGELNEVETQISQLSESLSTIEDRVFRTEVRS
ncbi:MAG: biotin/lipoyl-binding protein, partial [Alphaproteobacteria bacterium]|nr:biotin/lipoyl-binding protein [Alphaproteobacteria bacterium]